MDVERGHLEPIEQRARLYARGYGVIVSVALHALVLALLALPLTSPPAPLQESLPVEIWTTEEWQDLTPPAKSEITDLNRSQPQAISEPDREQPNTIRATKILSGEKLANPASRKMREALSLFATDTRLEQLCDIEASAQIAASFKQFHPDRIVAYAKSDVTISDDIVVAEGAAFRSRRQWYGLAFKCELSADRQTVQSFEFSVSEVIPKLFWDKYNLPDPALDTD